MQLPNLGNITEIVIKPVIEADLTFNELLAGITEDNIRKELDTSFAIGKEAFLPNNE